MFVLIILLCIALMKLVWMCQVFVGPTQPKIWANFIATDQFPPVGQSPQNVVKRIREVSTKCPKSSGFWNFCNLPRKFGWLWRSRFWKDEWLLTSAWFISSVFVESPMAANTKSWRWMVQIQMMFLFISRWFFPYQPLKFPISKLGICRTSHL